MAQVFQVNGRPVQVDVDPHKPLLWVLREDLGLTGSKFGCGAGLCGACAVHIDGAVARSCMTPVQLAAGKSVTTIEGLAPPGGALHPLQAAWIAEQVPQCGYCQSGMLMAAAALLKQTPRPTEADIQAKITNICRCGTYPRIRRAILRASRT